MRASTVHRRLYSVGAGKAEAAAAETVALADLASVLSICALCALAAPTHTHTHKPTDASHQRVFVASE